MRKSIRVRGVTYTSPDEAYVAAAELEQHGETVAHGLRFDGKDAEADQVHDRARADAEKLRAWAREREAAEAGDTEQPADVPKAPPKDRRRASRPKSRASRRRSSRGPALTPRTRSLVRQTRIPSATSTASGLALQVAGMTLGVAFLTLLLTDRGVSAFADLAGGAANGLRWILDPVDPLAPRPKPAAGAASATATAAALRSTRPARQAGVGALLTVGGVG